MTLTLDIPTEMEGPLKADAQARGVAIEAAALEAIANTYQEQIPLRRAAVEAAHGCAKTEAWLDDWMIADFNAGKREDIERENTRDLI